MSISPSGVPAGRLANSRLDSWNQHLYKPSYGDASCSFNKIMKMLVRLGICVEQFAADTRQKMLTKKQDQWEKESPTIEVIYNILLAHIDHFSFTRNE